MPAPRNPKEVKQFLGLVGYYRKFVPRFADISRVLTHLTKKDVEFKWMPECESCFQILKEFLQQAPILRYPDPQASYTLYTDPIEINTDIHLPLKDDKLVKLQESDPHMKQLRKQWKNKNLDQNTYTMENNI